jgi:hypothetical protein
VDFKSFHRDRNGDVYIGTVDGLGTYTGYLDSGSSYRFRYFSPGLTFGDPSKIKMLKKIRPVLIGGFNTEIFLKWSYDFSGSSKTRSFSTSSSIPGFFGESEYAVAEYTEGDVVSRKSFNTSGNGSVVTVGLETNINGYALSIQEMSVLALVGKTL